MKKASFKLIFGLCGILLLAFIILNLLDNTLVLNEENIRLRANNTESAFLRLQYKNFLRQALLPYKKKSSVVFTENQDFIQVLPKESGFLLKSKWQTGLLKGHLKTETQQFNFQIELIADLSDMDQDGFPDVAELTNQSDREAFQDWFVSIAESQFYKPAAHWYAIHRHCAGLINFAYKEALKKHSSAWHRKFPFLITTDIPELSKFTYPDIPLLGTLLFRKSPGPFNKKAPLSDQFENTANVSTLLNFNLQFISRDKKELEKGDLIFFHRDDAVQMPYHSMIYNGKESLIYHTGPLPDKPQGEVRKVEWDTLSAHPDRAWHPKNDNPNFLGIYRFKILL